jgi:hypothetical protein
VGPDFFANDARRGRGLHFQRGRAISRFPKSASIRLRSQFWWQGSRTSWLDPLVIAKNAAVFVYDVRS